MFGIWFTSVLEVYEGWLQQESGNGRCVDATYLTREEAERQCELENENPLIAHFAFPYQSGPNAQAKKEFRLAWLEARKIAKARLRKRLL